MQQPVRPLCTQQHMQPLPHVLYAHCLLPPQSMRSISGTPAIDHIATRCVFEIPWARVRSPPPFLTLRPDDSNATVRLVARGIEQARRGGCRYPEGTTERCPSPDDY